MATLKQRMHKKNSSGSYDTVHLETSSSLVLRPSGRTVEQDLADYLPKTQASDTPPSTLKSASLIVGTSKAWIGINETPEELIFMGSELNIGTINGLTVDQILDKMVEKKIGIAGGAGPGSGGLTFDPHKITVGTRVNQFGGTSWIVAHKTATRLYLASEHIFTLAVKFGDSNAYLGSNLQLHARGFNDIFSDYEKSWMVANPDNGDLIGPMSYKQLNGGFSYFNSDSRRACDNKVYWTSSRDSGYVCCVNTDGSLYLSNPSDARGFRPFVCLSL